MLNWKLCGGLWFSCRELLANDSSTIGIGMLGMSHKNEFEQFKRHSQESFQKAKKAIFQHGVPEPIQTQTASGCLVIMVLLFIIILVVAIFR
jgi:hypothetical protein